jgi:predicted O-linked N-acetylglucosamine transferase (SPINDLY family)
MDGFTNALLENFEQVIDLSHLDDAAALAKLREDRLDILICIDGYSARPRSAIVKARAAPAQVSWLGFPSTMGSRSVDYVIGDAGVLPDTLIPFSTRRRCGLPGGYLPIDGDHRVSNRYRTRADLDLPEDVVVMSAFHQTRKIGPAVLDVWSAVLKEVENSILWLWIKDPAATHNLMTELERRGVPPDRVYIAPSVSQADHLRRYRFVDLFLDTWPYTGHTTTNVALFMGLPGVTMTGRTFASRVSFSLMQRLALGDLVAETQDGYIQRAINLAMDADFRARKRYILQARAKETQAFSGVRYVREFESALARIADLVRTGAPPSPFDL